MTGRWARSELAAAGIGDPLLQQGFLRARVLNAQHGKTYYLAALLLPPAKRPYVHALYGFARFADDIVDNLDPAVPLPAREAEFRSWSATFLADLAAGSSADPLIAAVISTVTRWQIEPSYFADFLDAMAMDLSVTEYQTYADLERYMWGSAAVIGLQMLPILGYDRARAEFAERTARDLGIAFQLTNFLRDIGEDLRRGRVYLPQESLAAAGVDRSRLESASRLGLVDEPIRTLLRSEVARARDLYRAAEPGIGVLDPSSRACMRTAFRLYGDILTVIERSDYNVFARRATVSLPRRARVASLALLGARITRVRKPTGSDQGRLAG